MPYDKVLQENIEFSDAEEKVVSTDEFKRLKFIKQNGFAYLVYHDATNNRFDHSIGTMYWATHLFESIKRRQKDLTKDDLQAVRLAALVHDIGHGPFSHVIEMLFERNPILWNYKPWTQLREEFGNGNPHELLTLRFVNSKIFKQLMPKPVKDLKNEINEILKKKSNLSLLISGDLDADRLDYLARDSYHSGLPFGLNVRPIFNQLIHENINIDKKGSIPVLVVDSKAIPAIEQLLMARYAHYYYIAYDSRILSTNLFFVTELERGLWKGIKKKSDIALAIYYIYTELIDNELIDLDFSRLDKKKRELLERIRIESSLERIRNLKNPKDNPSSTYIRLSSLGKRATYDFFRNQTTESFIKKLEELFSRKLSHQVRIHLCIPKALTTKTCVFDKNIREHYNPALLYDYSPLVRSLEQKMYQDCGIVVTEPISHDRLLDVFYSVERDKTDFDMYAYAIYRYIKKVPSFIQKNMQKWKLRRGTVFEFINKFHEHFLKEEKLEKRLTFEMPWYCVEIYELLQKLEFMDFIDENFNLGEGNGIIPSYSYSIGEYGEELLKSIKLSKNEKHEIEQYIEDYLRSERY